jgi:hypothetical protein
MPRDRMRADWREAEYDYLRGIDGPGLAWEWLRRNRLYREEVAQCVAERTMPARRNNAAPPNIQTRWGCVSLQAPEVSAAEATPLWSRTVDSSVLIVRATPARSDDPIAFVPRRWTHLFAVAIEPDGTEHLAICDGYRRIRLDVAQGTVLEGPVLLRYEVQGVAGIDGKVLTLRRLMALCRTGRFARSLHRSFPSAPRLVRALRAHDAIEFGASIRDVGIMLFGDYRVAAEWNAPGEALKSQCRRLIATSRRMIGGGYLNLLRA